MNKVVVKFLLPSIFVCLLAGGPVALRAADKAVEDAATELPSIEAKTEGMEAHPGFFSFWWDENTGRLFLQVDATGGEFLYVNALSTGLGSNPVGLDRGQLDRSRVVRFQRIGPQLFLQQRNLRHRALNGDRALENTVDESFATSILWGTKIQAESNGRVLVDATPFLLRDAHGIAQQLKRTGQNDFSLDKERCAISLPHTKSFPDNTEFDAVLTFQSKNPGPLVRRTTPSPEAVTLRLHHSFVRLPDNDYRPRRFDPRAPSFSIDFADHASAIDETLQKQWIVRHRLEKLDPTAERSSVKKPIVYYVDPGAPPTVRRALVEGASWWSEAFEEAGFVDAFRVEVLPDDVDPLDVRYNVIMWVHRATRGWSYGSSVVDPRTGEILKGHVTLGALRVRQDILLLDGLQPATLAQACRLDGGRMGPAERTLAAFDPQVGPVELALARIRQLSAHEVGHTLGFAHNFAASTYGRASVMDYPAPLATVSDDGRIDLSRAYSVGIGEWDKFGVKYAYSQFSSAADERQELESIVAASISAGHRFLSDADARPAGAAHPLANLWDNGADPHQGLREALRVRQVALANFSDQMLPSGTPHSDLEASLVPLYLHHRYQVDACAKLLGGANYSYAVAGDNQTVFEWVPVQRQREALTLLLECLDPEQLLIPAAILQRIPPRPFGSTSSERFPKRTAMVFDPLAAVEVAAQMVVSNLFQHQRAARLAAQPAASDGFDLLQVVQQTLAATWRRPHHETRRTADVQRVVQRVVLDELIRLAGNSAAASDVRAVATYALRQERAEMLRRKSTEVDVIWKAHMQLAVDDIGRFLDRHTPPEKPRSLLEAPPGSPIGR